MVEYIFLFFAALLAFVVKGITGFGNTLVMGSLFSFIIPNKQTTPVDLLMGIPTNTYIAWRERKSMTPKVVIPLSCMVIAGAIPGAFLLKSGDDWVLRAAFGVITVGMAIEIFLRSSTKSRKSNRLLLIIIGVISGVFAGLFGIGALLVAYISRTADNKSTFRADICCVFLVENVFRLFLYIVTGIITRSIVFLTLTLLPAVALGLFIGIKLDAKMDDKAATKTIILLLAISGLTLFIKSVFFH